MLRTFLLRSLAVLSLLALLPPVCAFAQSRPSAYVHRHSIYVGGEYALWNSDYFGDNQSLNKSAYTIYGDYMVWNGAWPVSLEVNYTQLASQENDKRDMFSFLSGPKISHHFGRWEPFAKVGAGIGHFRSEGVLDQPQIGNHFAIGFGGGLEYKLTSRITLRPVDYTFERWNFSPHALSPSALGFGLSYRIH